MRPPFFLKNQIFALLSFGSDWRQSTLGNALGNIRVAEIWRATAGETSPTPSRAINLTLESTNLRDEIFPSLSLARFPKSLNIVWLVIDRIVDKV